MFDKFMEIMFIRVRWAESPEALMLIEVKKSIITYPLL
jgi:hypothetical protein